MVWVGAGEDENHIPFLVTEYCARGALDELLANKTVELPWLTRRLHFAIDAAQVQEK